MSATHMSPLNSRSVVSRSTQGCGVIAPPFRSMAAGDPRPGIRFVKVAKRFSDYMHNVTYAIILPVFFGWFVAAVLVVSASTRPNRLAVWLGETWALPCGDDTSAGLRRARTFADPAVPPGAQPRAWPIVRT